MPDDALHALAHALNVEPLSPQEQQLLLDCARDVAHNAERRYAPLSTFLLGVAAASSDDRARAVEDGLSAIRVSLGLMPPEDPPAS